MSTDVEEVNHDRLDKVIRRYAGIKSARQIADLTGYTPDEVIRRRNALVDSIDELSLQAQMSFILSELQDTAREYRAKADQIDPNDPDTGRNIGPIITASIQAQKAAMQQLQNIQKANQGAVEALNSKRIAELTRLVDLTVVASVAVIAERHGLDESELLSIFQERLVKEAERLEIE